ncbi:MAG: hypothetical protein A2665_00720 [Candidatus Zambryskibacteria bacterium RIFCSPHIGHO2_01_FULL_46_30]|uniref:Multidrug ABC transporter substrate-binding protein n=1 Tax=Candidatus Zambryskibacteria bacterium RIFCSPHIGHO2_01_FULL_46_30 TaxID=1802739 RepID=A0A1G2T0I9_9BACT|nr:MAG: hypothetical protein A2665_00720 [Candidatus Zambryskibacteria bacterium RIFCSPHIGHO2_01_FULL_46_30]OHB05255.1 MAG: hypothetical protein A3B22_03165 [Candidatus Zambryskibacteria bacterium RIFCSPLOWO2_01_FULL_47_33]
MNLNDILQETYTALVANKTRSILTMLGIIIGIGSVIAMISLGQGASGSITSSIQGLGSNLLTIVPGAIEPGRGQVSSGRGSAETLKNADVVVLEKIPGVAYVSPELVRRFQIIAPTGNNTNSSITGVSQDYASVHSITMAQGSFITDANIRSLSKVAVLGPTIAADLFGEENTIGKTIRINSTNFKIIGISESKGGSGFGGSPDESVYVSLPVMQRVLAGADYLSTIAVSVENEEMMPQVQEEITATLIQKHRVDVENPDFSIISQKDILSTLDQITGILTIFLASIAGISLLVGGIGIMNMMLTTVTERTREIGLRKAIGATKKNISLQFLAESILLTFTGGVIGVILGWLISFAVSSFAGIDASVSLRSVALAFGVSAGIGIIFGYYPARRASSLNPIEALRHE